MKRAGFILLFLTVAAVLLAVPFFPEKENETTDKQDHAFHHSEEKVLRVAGDAFLPPFSYVNDDGEFTGFSVALMHAVAEASGLNLEFVPMNLYKAEEALIAGDIDAIIGLKYTAEREDAFDFSESYYIASDGIVVPKRKEDVNIVTDLKYNVVAIQDDDSTFDLLQNVRRAQLNIAQNERDALRLLMMGRADAYVGSRRTAMYYLDKWKQDHAYKVLESPVQPAEFAVAVQNGDSELLDQINQGLLTVRANGTYEQLFYEWFNNSTVLMTRLKYLVYVLAAAVIVIGIVLVIGFIWNKRLKKEVLKQTKTIREANKDLQEKRQDIADQNAFKEQILNSTPSGIVTLDQSFKVTSMNHEARRLFGETEMGRVHPLIKKLFDTNSALKDVYQGETALQYADDEYVIHYHIRPIYDAEGQHTGYLLTFENRTEEKKLQQKLAVQEKMHALGQLSAGIAHEMRNPLTSVKTFVELLPQKYDQPDFRKEIVQHVPAEIDRLNQTIEDLLDYSRPKAPKKQLFSAKPWLDSILALFRPTLRQERIDLHVDVQENLSIYADEQQIKQVIVNMILNAIDALKHSHEKQLTVQMFQEENWTKINITDSGTGMNKKQIDKIYEPFFTTKDDGVGLGLTISFQFVRENGGDVFIDSTPGIGTTFVVSLPAGDERSSSYESHTGHR